MKKTRPLPVRKIASIGAIIPFLLGGIGAIIAHAAAPKIPLLDNNLAFFCLCLCATSLLAAVIPPIFKWDWRAKYFGFSIVYLASASLIGIVPWLCIILYSALPLWLRLCLLIGYVTPILWWCSHFVVFYRQAFTDRSLRNTVYQEDDDAVYYVQQNDKWLIETKCTHRIFPSSGLIMSFLALAFLLIPFIGPATKLVGLPFPYLFLTVSSLPIIMLFWGIAIKGYLVFYHYPRRIRRETGKDVYVDMATTMGTLGQEPTR